MSLDQLNLYLFHLLNVPDQASIWMINYASLIAHDLVYLFLLIFAIAWLRGNREVKTVIIKAFIFTAITLFISEVLSAVLNTPRPFVMEIGHTLIEHEATGSFPSNHMSIFSGIALAYYFSPQRDLGRLLLWTAWLVAWSRIYVGVHFPIDMAGAFLIALVVNLAGLSLWWKYQEKLMDFILSIYQFLFAPLIRMGWIK
ncbi:phosphatase PAP2 family protein [Acinetobacter schindleri]|uniref:phosphatase PAP2 family protein n=1 Tax=Acinetobacter schindleri TaxID=108981 RepID=UPI0013B075BD|nr:phosphatase PAP2 family protein [Acinetobacter schindleri]QIC64621.1 phosphatase PAP2 family protein [Acinetobacter schindleri]